MPTEETQNTGAMDSMGVPWAFHDFWELTGILYVFLLVFQEGLKESDRFLVATLGSYRVSIRMVTLCH